MKIISIFLILIFSLQNTSADIGDSIAKIFFQKKVDQIYNKALACPNLEIDAKANMNVNDWIKIQPELPNWRILSDIEAVAKEARQYAKAINGNDKVRHCLAGCFIAKKLDYKSAALVGWLKELQDASDCSLKTTFEKADYDATIKGAVGSVSGKECESFCKRKN